MLTTTLAALLVAWMVLSMLNQVNPISSHLARYDPLGLLPRWTFFAPHPGIYDYHLLYRECKSLEVELGTLQKVEASKDIIGPWTPVPEICPSSTRLPLWNPQRRVTKTITDVVAGLTMLRLEHPTLGDGVQYTSYYWLLLHLIQLQSRRDGQRQFAVIQSHGFPPQRKSAVFFVSKFHSVRAEQ